ncbi:unnamed protein product [Larinioides sclopetarius]|uniref:F-box only protein 22 n=1 Tax=Larinioides sclopetarius TaxID=280406 RepID=A0AAV1ZCN8_9ARAC
MEKKLAITANPLIVEKIFHFLNARDLSSCARVCSLWFKISEAEKRRRKDITWIFTVGPCPGWSLKHIKSCGLLEHHEVENSIFNQLENLQIQPVFCTAFMSTCLFEKVHKFFPSFGDFEPTVKRSKPCESVSRRKYLNSVMDTVLKSFLPENCKMTFTVSTGIIGYKADKNPVEIENGPAIAGYFIPQIPGVEVKHYAISGKNSSLAEFISKNAPVKCLLLFLTSRGASIANKLVRSCCPEDEEISMAVGGAIVERTESLLGSATAFCGPNVDAASVIINASDKAEEVTAKLEVFRETGLLENKCIAYMFVCVGRGYYFHEDHNVESAIFSKLYPKVPIIGVFGEGEIGVNYIPNVTLENKKLKIGKFKNSKRFLHGYTTIFVLISIKM